MARDVDTLVAVAPGGASTFHLVNAEVLAALGPNGILINIGRGSVVDEAALAAALNAGTILGAGLDVFETEPCWPKDLMACERTVLLPHVGSGSIHTREAMGQLAVDNLVSWFETGKPLTPVVETPWTR
jgi:lactate dehydrogenase-like 2-hydroxyacid dehydrogenase